MRKCSHPSLIVVRVLVEGGWVVGGCVEPLLDSFNAELSVEMSWKGHIAWGCVGHLWSPTLTLNCVIAGKVAAFR